MMDTWDADGTRLEEIRLLAHKDDSGDTSFLLRLLDNEIHDVQMISHEVSKVYDALTHGRISKPHTAADCVISEVEELQADELEPVLAALKAVADHLRGMLTGPIVSRYVTFENGVDEVPTLKTAYKVLGDYGL